MAGDEGDEPGAPRRPVLFTIGHSTHPLERFLELLAAQRVATLCDVRSFPSSRRWPQFNQMSLRQALEAAGIGYRWARLLGGRRHGERPDSPHTAWTHPAFRSYADYMDSADFEAGIAELIAAALSATTAIMCSEGLWWRCHRRIVADQMLLRGFDVEHILPSGRLARHELSPFASVADGRLVYNGSPPAKEP